jgi:23S rRNA (guanosine2251-2'-O)-methyltransferase
MKEWITGRNPVYECLRSNRRHFFRLLTAEGVIKKGRIQDILKLARSRNISAEYVDRHELNRMGKNNQGIALEASEYSYSDLEMIFQKAEKASEPLLMLMLDQIQDPQNFGTLIRSAELFGVHGILIPPRRAAGITPAVVSASSGASEHLLVAQGNLAQAIDRVKEQNGWVIGLDMDVSSVPLSQVDWSGGTALVVGSEGSGLRRLVREKCDLIAHIPMKGQLDSLNAAVAGSIALYAASQLRKA